MSEAEIRALERIRVIDMITTYSDGWSSLGPSKMTADAIKKMIMIMPDVGKGEHLPNIEEGEACRYDPKTGTRTCDNE